MARRRWEKMSDEDLLDVRLCDLGLKIEGTVLEQRVAQLHDELDRRGFRFRPHFWLSDEWFAPTDVPGIALPFYLAHPRLSRLEKKMMLEVEGGSAKQCMRLLRHECGHTLQFAYGLHRRRRWQQLFGRSSQPYPDAYRPRPYSRSFVLHIDNNYAQAHPDEDFAETFAVWLTPHSSWRKRYATWPALRKLEYVDELMQEISDQRPKLRSRSRVHALREITITLREHYRARQSRYALDEPDVYVRDLRRLFAVETGPAAATFLRRHRKEVLSSVSRWTGQYKYTINEVYGEMIDRCREHGLRVDSDADEGELVRETAVLLAVQTMNQLNAGGHWIKL
jgi:hypothetical protein